MNNSTEARPLFTIPYTGGTGEYLCMLAIVSRLVGIVESAGNEFRHCNALSGILCSAFAMFGDMLRLCDGWCGL